MTDENTAPVAIKTGSDIKSLLELVVRVSGAFEGTFNKLDMPLTISQWAALDALIQTDAERPYQLAKKLCISRQRAWQIAKSLETAGYVQLSEHDSETKGVNITVTEKGIAIFQTFEREIFDKVADYINSDKPKLGFGGTRAVLRSMGEAFEFISQDNSQAA